MKIKYQKLPGGVLSPADQQAYEESQNLKNYEYYEVTIKLDQNYRLHAKMFAFFTFCAKYYFGDSEVTTDQVEYVRKNLIVSAGYVRTLIDPRTAHVEIIAESLKYSKMPPEERSKCYKALVSAAIKTIWDNKIDQRTENELLNFMN